MQYNIDYFLESRFSREKILGQLSPLNKPASGHSIREADNRFTQLLVLPRRPYNMSNNSSYHQKYVSFPLVCVCRLYLHTSDAFPLIYAYDVAEICDIQDECRIFVLLVP